MALGARIRVRRNELKLSQSVLGDAIGVTYQQIQKYEKGLDRISVSTLVKIARRLGSTVAALIGEEPGSTDDGIAPRLAVPGALELLSLYSRIENNQTRRRLLDLLGDLATAGSGSSTSPSPAKPWKRGIKKDVSAPGGGVADQESQ